MWPPPKELLRYDGDLTGRRRYRISNGRMILQIEKSFFSKRLGCWNNIWCDAIPEDLPDEDIAGIE